METNLNEYQKFYDEYKDKITNANDCVLSFPCSKLVAEIDVIINYLQGLTKTNNWNDSAKTKFDESINALVTEFNTLKENINSSWVEAEEIYKNLPEFFEHLNENICYLKTKLDHPIKKNNYIKVNELGEVTYPGYERDLSEWKYNCNTYSDACSHLISEIEGKLNELNNINNSTVENIKVTINALSGLQSKKVADLDKYRYYMGDSAWADKKFYGSGGGNIKGNGCSLLAASIGISLCLDERITPDKVNDKASQIKAAGSANRPQFIVDVVSAYGLNTNVINKANTTEKEAMFQRIANGESVATVRIAPNNGTYKTKNGHYINIVGYKVENGVEMVNVFDSGHRSEPQRCGWHPLSEIESVAKSDKTFTEISSNDISNDGVKV